MTKRVLLSLLLACGLVVAGWWLFRSEGSAYHVVRIRGSVFAYPGSHLGLSSKALSGTTADSLTAITLREGDLVTLMFGVMVFSVQEGDSVNPVGSFRWSERMGTELHVDLRDKVVFVNGRPTVLFLGSRGSGTIPRGLDWRTLGSLVIMGSFSPEDAQVFQEVLHSGARPGVDLRHIEVNYADTAAAERFRQQALHWNAQETLMDQLTGEQYWALTTAERDERIQDILEKGVVMDSQDSARYNRWLDPGIDVDTILGRLAPQWVWMNTPTRRSTWELLERNRKLDLLGLVGGEPDLQGLLAMPALRTLYLEDVEVPDTFTWRSKALTELSVVGVQVSNLHAFTGLRRLQALHLASTCHDTTLALTALDSLPLLEAFSLQGFRSVDDLAPIGRLGRLRYLYLSPVDSTGFAALAGHLGMLEVLTVGDPKSEHPVDLGVVDRMPSLRALSVLDRKADLTQLFGLRDLAFLSIDSERYEEDSLRIAELKEALPNTVIVPHSGFCVGSGWLLLAAPILALMAWGAAVRRRSRRSQQVAA